MVGDHAGTRDSFPRGHSTLRGTSYYRILAVAGVYLVLVFATGVQRNCASTGVESAATPIAVEEATRAAADAAPAALTPHHRDEARGPQYRQA